MTHSKWIALIVAALVVGASAGWNYSQAAEAQKITADDYVEILQGYSEYVQGIDGIAGDCKGEHYADAFTEDGIMQAGPERLKNPLGGRANIVKMGTKKQPCTSSSRHMVVNPVVRPNGDGTARVSAYILLLNQASNPPVLLSHRATNDLWVKTPKGWKMKHRINSTIKSNTPFDKDAKWVNGAWECPNGCGY
jgi:hypothetical protein